MSAVTTNNEAEILSRVIARGEPNLPPDTAKIILTFDFGREDHDRINQLAQERGQVLNHNFSLDPRRS